MVRKLVFGAGIAIAVAAGTSGALLVSSACRVDVPYFCCTYQESCDQDHGGGVITPCLPRYPDRPFCDDQGQYPASNGIGRTCIPDPLPDGGAPACGSS